MNADSKLYCSSVSMPQMLFLCLVLITILFHSCYVLFHSCGETCLFWTFLFWHRLVHMWRNMYECHQVQNHIAQQATLLGNTPGSEPTSDTHCQATSQLEIEVSGWHSAFCNLIALQREYISTLNQWIKLTDCLPDDDGLMKSSSGIRSLSEELQRALERLPEKV